MDKETTNTKDRGPLIAEKGHEDFSDNRDYNIEGNKDMNTEEDEDMNIKEDKDIDAEENKDINAKENEDINIKENGGYNIIPHKLIAGSEADSNTGSDEYNTLAEPKQDAIPINTGALTKVTKNNTASEYIASIDKFADLVN